MIDYAECGARAAASPLRCVVLARHGERPPIEEGDPTFGEELPITEAGRELSLSCGRALAAGGADPADWAFWASRLRRTRLTAAAAAEGMGRPGAEVRVTEEASLPGLWITDQLGTWRGYRRLGTEAFTDVLMSGAEAEGYRPIPESTRLAVEWISAADFGARCAFVATHDVFVACLLQGLGAGRFSSARWVGFLQACALFERADGGWDAEYCVPDKARWEQRFFQ